MFFLENQSFVSPSTKLCFNDMWVEVLEAKTFIFYIFHGLMYSFLVKDTNLINKGFLSWTERLTEYLLSLVPDVKSKIRVIQEDVIYNFF